MSAFRVIPRDLFRLSFICMVLLLCCQVSFCGDVTFELIAEIDVADFGETYLDPDAKDPCRKNRFSASTIAQFSVGQGRGESGQSTFILTADAGCGRIVWRRLSDKATTPEYRWFNARLVGPQGIAGLNEGGIIVSDTGRFRIVKLAFDGNEMKYVAAIGSKGSSATQFDMPRCVRMDRYGGIYVVDNHNNCIKKFNARGGAAKDFEGMEWFPTTEHSRTKKLVPTNRIGSYGSKPGNFMVPLALAIGWADDCIYVSDIATARIQKFDANGKLVKWVWLVDDMLPNPVLLSMDVDLYGRVFVVDRVNNVIYIVNKELELVGTYKGPEGSPFEALSDVVVDKFIDESGRARSEGLLCTTEEQRVRVFRISSPGR